MSLDGLLQLKNYLLSNNLRILEPLFIAQYLLVPVNTIVTSYLMPWMATDVGYDTNLASKKMSEKTMAKNIKAKVYLKYTYRIDECCARI